MGTGVGGGGGSCILAAVGHSEHQQGSSKGMLGGGGRRNWLVEKSAPMHPPLSSKHTCVPSLEARPHVAQLFLSGFESFAK